MLERQSTADRDFNDVVLGTAFKGSQAAALLSPPLLLILSIRNRSFRPTTFLRNSGLATLGVGPAAGAGLSYARLHDVRDEKIHAKAIAVRSDRNQRRLDDWSLIGAVLGSLVTTTIFLKRVRLPYTVVGGAALGVTGATVAHLVTAYKEGQDVSPRALAEKAEKVVDQGA